MMYNPVVEGDESTVVSEFIGGEDTESAYQSEADLEREFIENLQSQSYEYLPITSEAQLIANLRTQLERLNSITFSDAEWEQFFREGIAKANDGHLEKTIRIQEDHVQILKRDDGSTKNVALIDKTNIHNNRLQVINQYAIAKGEGGAARSNRYDVTVLVNGLPLVHIELKRRGVPIREAFNQIDRYQRDSFWAGSGLFDYVQVFVISNGTETKYYSNTVRRQRVDEGKPKSKKLTSSSFEFTSWWADAANKPIFDLVWFTKTFFAKHTLLNVLTKYCVLTSDKELLVMRPYQIVATERILNRIAVSTNYHRLGTVDAGGYIWHTTGSGKTLTSFKTAQLATKLDYIDKVLFVVDRKDLDYQTMKEYDRFKKGAANSNRSTRVLKEQLEDPDRKIIITTIQKLSKFIAQNKAHPVYGKHVVIIFDECHRSQFGDMHFDITKSFKNYHIFGFTGTPIFVENMPPRTNNHYFQTTEQAFGEQLHSYTLTDAINDKNVLKFYVEYWATLKTDNGKLRDEKVKDINRTRVLLDHKRLELIVAHILEGFNRKTMRDKLGNGGFNALFATSSIEAAKRYYEVFKEQQKDLPEEQRIKVGIIYSYSPNEDDGSNLGLNDEGFETEQLDQSSRDFLDAAIDDYNAMYHTTYDTSSEGFRNYYRDLSQRIKDREIDLVIVVNMFLTGFDAKTLNTLYVDKKMVNHGLLQACSRTNRIYNSVKDKGNVYFFLNLQKELDDALALFGNKDASSALISIEPYAELYQEYSEQVRILLADFPLGQPIIGETRQKAFVIRFSRLLRNRNLLLPSDEFAERGDPLSERQIQDYTSFYLNIRDDFARKERNEQEVIDEDIVFELELVKQIEINVDYILLLVERWLMDHQGDIDPPSRDAFAERVQHAVDASPSLRNKSDLIMEFVRSVSTGDTIDTEWQELVIRKQKEELDAIIARENLKPAETRKLIARALKEGSVPATGTAITNIIQPTSRFLSEGALAEYKDRVFAGLSAFVERFHQLGFSDMNQHKPEG
ncbi:MAG: type I restriction endonuclease subunit R [Ferrimicrobium acidiphilum]